MAELTHFTAAGDAHMVDVGGKEITHRVAVAEGRILMHRDTLELIMTGGHEKGDVLGIARIAGIMAAKRTPDLIPLCHPVPLSRVEVELDPRPGEPSVRCRVTAEAVARTGVEMEAMAAAQVALLSIYDMCKAVDRGMTIADVRLMEKSGGRSGTWKRSPE